MEFSERGIPILSLDDKLDALKMCIEDCSDEDAIGHLFDLMYHVIPYHTPEQMGILYDHYGVNPTLIRCSDDRARALTQTRSLKLASLLFKG